MVIADPSDGGRKTRPMPGDSANPASNSSSSIKPAPPSAVLCKGAANGQPVDSGRDLPLAPLRLRVLVVDDHGESGECLSRMMRRAGNDVRLASDGLEAVRVAATFQPDVVLLDIGLPRMNGYEAACHIRRQTWGGKATLIAVTGWGQDGDIQKSREAGFDHHLVKPVALEILLQLLASLQNRPAVGPA